MTKFKAVACGLALVAGMSIPLGASAASATDASAGQAYAVQAVGAANRAAAKQLPSAAEKVQGRVTLTVDFQYQETGYWCGPAATRIALSARIAAPSQAHLAADLGTTTNGTDWIGQVTRELNAHIGGSYYETKEMPNDPPTQAQRNLLWQDVVYDIDRNYPIVANIVAPANNHPPGYPNYTIWHYFTVIGYDSNDMTVLIADPAGFGPATYWLTFNQLATLIPPKGYSA
jgi:hypothetical protein